eukprot:1635941-Heterocapsa_arctica.AAC.1
MESYRWPLELLSDPPYGCSRRRLRKESVVVPGDPGELRDVHGADLQRTSSFRAWTFVAIVA